MAKVNPKHQKFLAVYQKTLNAAEAYRQAYNYTGGNENVLSSQLIAKLSKQGLVEPVVKRGLDIAVASAQDVLKELTAMSTSDVADLLWKRGELDHEGKPTTPGSLKGILDMPPHIRRCIRSIERDADGNLKIRLWDKNVAATNLARYHKLLTDRLEVEGKLSLEELVAGSIKTNGKGDKNGT
jgi:hypothetical protein